jgi:hypothetical protein
MGNLSSVFAGKREKKMGGKAYGAYGGTALK